MSEGTDPVRADRIPGSHKVTLSGAMEFGEPERIFRLGLDNPAKQAAELFKQHLLEHDIIVSGSIKVHSQPNAVLEVDTSEKCEYRQPPTPDPEYRIIAELPPPDWQSIFDVINKDSQNLYAEIVLRHLGRICGSGTTQEGLERVTQLLTEAGAASTGFDFFDGSGMSVYNRVSPRTLVKLLTYADKQYWGGDWKSTFPIGGVDGSLKYRFVGTPLDGKIFAKTGTLKGVNALSGYMISASGQELAFSIIANDRPLDIKTATPYMDQALIEIAEKY